MGVLINFSLGSGVYCYMASGEGFDGIWLARGNVSEGLRDVGNQGGINRDNNIGTLCYLVKRHVFRDFHGTVEKLSARTMKGLSGLISWITFVLFRHCFTKTACFGSV